MKLYIKNMVSNRCKMIVKSELKELGLHFIIVDLGEVEIMEKITSEQRILLNQNLEKSGLGLMDDKKKILIEKIKNIIVELVYYSEKQPKINLSDFISEKLNYDYTYLANLFSENQSITIEHFFLNHKIERVKELLVYEDISLTEISYKLHYSSVGHLSNQFKKMTGLSPTKYKKLRFRNE
ncbi:MAG TPA: helix-turn-helix domain-containing protein [Prolixibacteraceae bacterium]|nr:helix-turn-helix domain-containing protein [Prolixibacteraceae bacterium]